MTLHEPIGKFHAKEICQLIITRLLERRLRGYRSSSQSHERKKFTFSCACIISKPPDFYISTDHHDLKIKLFQKVKIVYFTLKFSKSWIFVQKFVYFCRSRRLNQFWATGLFWVMNYLNFPFCLANSVYNLCRYLAHSMAPGQNLE